jgi:pimeloyl-ACP methyl ester carboxylesterase
VPALRRQFRRQALLADTLGRIGPIRRAVVHAFLARTQPHRHLVSEAVELLAAQTAAMPGATSARIARALGQDEPAVGRQRRIAVVIGLDDPLMPPPRIDAALAEIGVPPEHVLRLPDGGHFPHVESAAHPEWSARNAHDLARLIDAMLVTASERSGAGSDSPVALGSTVPVSSTVPA